MTQKCVFARFRRIVKIDRANISFLSGFLYSKIIHNQARRGKLNQRKFVESFYEKALHDTGARGASGA